jgi:hypothetical protein
MCSAHLAYAYSEGKRSNSDAFRAREWRDPWGNQRVTFGQRTIRVIVFRAGDPVDYWQINWRVDLFVFRSWT